MTLFSSSSPRVVVSSRTIWRIFLFISLICITDVDGKWFKKKKAPDDGPKTLTRKGKWKDQPAGIMANNQREDGIGIIQSYKSMSHCLKSDLDNVQLGFEMVPEVIQKIRLALDNPSRRTKKKIIKWFGKNDDEFIESLREDFYHIDSTFKSVKLYYRGYKFPDELLKGEGMKEAYPDTSGYNTFKHKFKDDVLYILPQGERTKTMKQMLMFIGPAFTEQYTGNKKTLGTKRDKLRKTFSFAGAVFHEMTHWYLITKDHTYGFKESEDLAKSNKPGKEAFTNANNWQFFFDEFNQK